MTQDKAYNHSDIYSVLKIYLQKQTGLSIQPETHIYYDLGLDSLMRMLLVDFIKRRFGVIMEEDDLRGHAELNSLAKYILEHESETDYSIGWDAILTNSKEVKLPKAWRIVYPVICLIKSFLKLYFRLEKKGLSNIPDHSCIMVSNHQSVLDILLITSSLKERVLHNTLFLAKEKHFKSRFLRFIANNNNIIVMDDIGGLEEAVQKMVKSLDKGKNVFIFPEGTRSYNGEVGEFKKTFATLSILQKVPIVPIVIKGAFQAMPRTEKYPKHKSPLSIEILPPINPEGFTIDTLTTTVYNQIKDKLS
ncbi:1-acyl-sn-glycerol-3-phosphate acyltransferase [Bacteroidales bacterium OttesenSCG-928-I14]|nr:1-acyl-sn-glycerol-3-phosphate acyltransferase [Bacteroidales bacterium OttesenSCG-928-I14]